MNSPEVSQLLITSVIVPCDDFTGDDVMGCAYFTATLLHEDGEIDTLVDVLTSEQLDAIGQILFGDDE